MDYKYARTCALSITYDKDKKAEINISIKPEEINEFVKSIFDYYQTGAKNGKTGQRWSGELATFYARGWGIDQQFYNYLVKTLSDSSRGTLKAEILLTYDANGETYYTSVLITVQIEISAPLRLDRNNTSQEQYCIENIPVKLLHYPSLQVISD